MAFKMREHFTKILTLLRKQIMEEADRTVTHMKDDLIFRADHPSPTQNAEGERANVKNLLLCGGKNSLPYQFF